MTDVREQGLQVFRELLPGAGELNLRGILIYAGSPAPNTACTIAREVLDSQTSGEALAFRGSSTNVDGS